MSYCFNPNCQRPHNPQNANFCQSCGQSLLLTNRYRCLKPIGQGGFGRTFLAVDQYKPSKSLCVIKQFYPLGQGKNSVEKAAELFAREAVRLDELGKHDHIPELLAYFTENGRQYLAQQYIEGQNLAETLATEGAFRETQIRELLNSLLPVLQFIHSQQVIHRDIKPENIIRRVSTPQTSVYQGGAIAPNSQNITPLKEGVGELFLVDFGSAKAAIRTAVAVTGTIIGSAGYAAPEQAMGKAIFASDIYSLGVTCINLLTQVEPFDLFDSSEGVWIWRDFLHNPVSDEIGQILDKMIEGASKHRYQSADEILRDLNPQQYQRFVTPSFPSPNPKATQSSASTSQTYSWRCVNTLIGYQKAVMSVAISPDGLLLISGLNDRKVQIWNLEIGKLLYTIKIFSGGDFCSVKSVAISPDGDNFAIGLKTNQGTAFRGKVQIWNVHTLKKISGFYKNILALNIHNFTSVVFSPDGTVLAGGCTDNTIKIWDTVLDQLIFNLTGHSKIVTSVAMSPDGKTLASGSKDKRIKLWNLDIGQEIGTLNGHSGLFAGIQSVAFSPDGQIIASGSNDKTIKLWDLNRLGEINTLIGHTSSVNSVAFSPDGQIIASGSKDKTIKLWDVNTGDELQNLTGHSEAVLSVAFSPDGKTIVSGSYDRTIRIWRAV
ncbi:MAG: protein kinase [Moorea sp. SIO2B7]|nr:protein kinase [Moorena sp. SIO2B7]